MSHKLSLLLLLGACVAATACEDTTRPSPDVTAECTSASTGSGDLATALSAARARWQAQGIHDYTLTFVAYCYCFFEYPQPLTVRVVADHVAWIEDAEGVQLPPEAVATRDLTVPHFFAEIEQILIHEPYSASACFDADLGYPRTFGVDFDAGTADDEFSHEIALTMR